MYVLWNLTTVLQNGDDLPIRVHVSQPVLEFASLLDLIELSGHASEVASALVPTFQGVAGRVDQGIVEGGVEGGATLLAWVGH